MYENQPIELYWDSSSVLDTATAGILREGGFSARPISLSQLSDRRMSEEAGPRVVCVQGFSGMQEAHIKSVRELLGPRVYLIFRIDNHDFDFHL